MNRMLRPSSVQLLQDLRSRLVVLNSRRIVAHEDRLGDFYILRFQALVTRAFFLRNTITRK